MTENLEGVDWERVTIDVAETDDAFLETWPEHDRAELRNFLRAWDQLPSQNLGQALLLDRLDLVIQAAKNIAYQPPWDPILMKLENLQAEVSRLRILEETRRDRRSPYYLEPKLTGEVLEKMINARVDRLKTTFPLLTTLCLRPVEKSVLAAYVQLAGQILVAFTALQGRPSRDNEIVRKACEVVRSMARDEAPKKIRLEELPTEVLLPAQYLGKLSQLKRFLGLLDIEVLFEDAADLVGDLGDMSDDNESSEEDDFDESKLGPFETRVKTKEGWDGSAFERDALPSRDGEPASPPKEGKKRRHSATGAGNAMAKANQRYRRARKEPSSGDLHLLLKTLLAGSKDEQEQETIIQILFMFFFGMDAGRLASLRIGDLFGQEPREGDLYYPIVKVLNLQSPYPVLKNEIPKEKQSFDRVVRVELPLPDCLSQPVESYCYERVLKPGARLFEGTTQSIHERCRRWLSQFKRRSMPKLGPSSRWTLKRIQSFVPHQSSRIGSADTSVTTLMLGLDDHLGRTKVHYLATDPGQLQAHFNDVVQNVFEEARLPMKGEMS